MTPSEIEQQAAEDAFLHGYHDIPDDTRLRAASYVGLCVQLQSSAPGTAAFMVIEAEKRRRDALPIAPGGVATNPASSQHDPVNTIIHPVIESPDKSPDNRPSWDNTWYGKFIIGLLIASVATSIGYLLRDHLGLTF